MKRRRSAWRGLKQDGWVEGLGPGTRLEIQVRHPSANHVVSVQQLKRWMNGLPGSPVETLKKAKAQTSAGRMTGAPAQNVDPRPNPDVHRRAGRIERRLLDRELAVDRRKRPRDVACPRS